MRCLGRRFVKQYMTIIYGVGGVIAWFGPCDKEYVDKWKNHEDVDIILSVTIIKDNFYHVIPIRDP